MKNADQAEWNGTLSNIKIFPTTYSELYQDLKNVPSRERGERIRMLAMLGLQSLKLTSHSNHHHARLVDEFENQQASPDHILQKRISKDSPVLIEESNSTSETESSTIAPEIPPNANSVLKNKLLSSL